TTGWDPIDIARAWVVLMQRLGYTRCVAQGGDWGNAVTEQMALQGPPALLAIHTTMPAPVPADIAQALQCGEPPPPACTSPPNKTDCGEEYEQCRKPSRTSAEKIPWCSRRSRCAKKGPCCSRPLRRRP